LLSSVLALLLPPPSVPYDWRNVEIVGGGFVTGILTHPKERDLVYARTDIGGAYRWNPRTSRWVPLMDWLTRKDWNLYGVESFAVDRRDPNRLYVAVGTYDNSWGGPGAILRSTDRGRTWRRTDLPFKNGGNMPGRSIGERLAVDPTDGRTVYFGTRNSGLWRSTDAGATWARVESYPKVTPRYDAPVSGAGWDRVAPEGHGVGWVLFDGPTIYTGIVRKTDNLYRSTDRGRTWQPVSGQPQGLMPHQAKLGADGTITIVYADAVGPNDVKDGAVWRFNTRSGLWTDVTPERPGEGNTYGYGGVAVDAKNPQTVMVSTLSRWTKGDTVFRSTDGGKRWISLKERAHRDTSRAPYLNWGRPEAEFGHWIGDVEIDPHNPDRAWYVTGATIWGTQDLRAADRGGTTNWLPRAEGLEETAVLDLVSPPAGAPLVSGLGDIGGFRHDDLRRSPSGGIWLNPILSNTDDLDVAELRPNLFVRVGRGGGGQYGSLSADGAKTWRPFASQPSGTRSGGTIAMAADGSRMVWIPEGAPAHVSQDGGRTWIACKGAPMRGRVVSDRSDARLFSIHDQGSGRVYVSRDGGASFEPGATGLPTETGKIVPVPGHPGHVWLPTAKGLLRASDGGQMFIPVTSVVAAEQVGFGRPAPGKNYPTIFLIGTVDGVAGIFRSTDEGSTWVRINDASTGFGVMNNITGDPKVFGRVYLGTNGRGVLVADPRKGR